ncbi:MAG: hypothetical protein WBX25_22695 [Rhodomicrobium sp.]
MRIAAGLFGIFCGAIVIAIAARYGFKTSDNDLDGYIWAFMFAADLRAPSKEADVLAAPESKPRLRSGHDGTRRRHYAQWHGHRDNASRRFSAGFPGILFSLFR